ncbi:MAG: amino acid adenylation domain-containing protein [Candidatus Sericytochromatia bacterium]
MMSEALALVSMACRFPGAETVHHFWQNLKNGEDLLSEIPQERWNAQRYYDPQPGVSGKCATTKGYFLADVRQFDAGFFKILPEDAEVMDPQQRILLELCFEAFVSAGYQREQLSGQKVGVFMGITKSDYQNNIAEALARQELTQKTVVTGILENLIAARISHYFDLTGPALTIDTACSSSLVALHLAKESILAGDCEMALVGGINLNLNVPAFLGMSAAQALSPGAHFHVFDQRANGFFMGEGGAVVLLKKHRQALADQDRILALLAGSAINNDGRSISPMAPRSSTQQAVLLKACEDAQINPSEITLIEAHGTGTQLGDAVEAQTLNAIFSGISPKPVLSSVKPNIGHLLSAAGMGSIIKVLLCFQHRQIPPLLHYAQPRKELQLETQGFCLNQDLLEIPAGQPMVAGINGFGFGGTNAHILLRSVTDALPKPPFQQVLPAYQKRDYWVGLKEHSAPETRPESAPESTPTVRVFESRWFARDLPGIATPSLAKAPLLLLTNPLLNEEQIQLAEHLAQAGQSCLCLQSWAEFERQINTDAHDYHLVLCLPLSAQGLYGFFQTLAKSPQLAHCRRLTIVTQGALPVGPVQAPILGQQAPFLLSGLLWGAASELNLPVLQIDLIPGEIGPQLGDLALYLRHSHNTQQSQAETVSQVALRGASAWQRSQRQVSLQTEPPLPSRIRQQGVYLITGGASGIGALIAESLVAQQTQLQVIVVGRREACEVPGLADLQVRFQAKGSELQYFRVDMSQPAEVKVLCQQILRKYAKLHGVVHAAGQVMPKDLRRSTFQERQEGMAPKVEGLIALRESLLELGLSPDFFVAFSSLSAAIPGFGRGLIDYVAANQFMDLYAGAVSRSALPIQMIQWGPWQGAGMATHPVLLKQLADQGIYALSPEEGISAFHAFIDGAFEQALIFKTPETLNTLSERLANLPRAAAGESYHLSPTPVFQVAPEAPENRPQNQPQTQNQPQSQTQVDLEQRLQQLIQAVLAESGEKREIGPEDNLMDLGLDSLTAIDLTQTLEDWGYQDLPFELFFEQQNIRELARYLLGRSPLLEEGLLPPPSPEQVNHPLSPIQTAFFMAQTLYERPNFSYFRLSLKRCLDPQLLEQALWDLLEQHSQLRAVFQQRIDALGYSLSYQILSRAQLQAELQKGPTPSLLLEISPELPLAEYEDVFVNQLFALNQAPLFRIGLQQSAEGSHLLLLFHHIVFDGISMKNFLQGLWARYRALESHTPYLASPLAVSYEDYLQTQQRYRESEAFHAAIRACSEYLQSKPLKALSSQPFLFELAERYTSLGAAPAQSQQRHLPQACSAALSQKAQMTQTPLQMLYLSAFFKALSQWTGQSQIWVQVASAGRHWPLAEIHSLIGSFAELFPVYADLQINQGLDLAQRLRQDWNLAQPLLRVGSDQISRLAQEHGISLPFSFSFAHFDYSWMPPADQAQVVSTQMRGFHAQTQLGLLISENHQGFYYALNTPQGLFAEAELEHLAELFEAALREIAEVAEAAEVATPDFWRDFQTAPAAALALKTPECEVSYVELRHTVKQLAHQLQSRGLSGGSRLVFWGEASAESICLLLACLALGVTWVPVDAQSPLQRVKEICRQAQAELWVSDVTPLESDEKGLLSLSELLQQARASQETGFHLPARSETAIAYIIFTSGSTGQPKGVPILYTALMRYLGWAIAQFGYGPHDRVILTSSLAFDASLRPILATLMTGACLCPVNDQTKRDPLALLNWVRSAQISVWSSVPGLWQGLIQALEGQTSGKSRPDKVPLPQLRLVQLGGEVLAPQWLERWQALMGSDRPLVNLYGPTETTINATHYWVQGPHPQGQPVPIGVALPYLTCRVMSAAGEPCACGEAGELWVSGPGLTPGYLSQEQAPFVSYLGERYYRTGDRVYQDAEGLFYYLGRQDRQIKLRGYRLEPAEIEAVLLRFPDLQEAWVDLLLSPSGAPQLLACVSSALALDPVELKNHLAQFLPGYMLPQQIYCLSAFPRLPNGKADLAALRQTLLKLSADPLPERLGSQIDTQADTHTPDATTTAVKDIWQSLLKHQDFNENSDFFQMGGDSLLLMQAYLLLQQDRPQLPKIAQFHSQRRLRDWVRLLNSGLPTTPESLNSAPQPETQPADEKVFGLSPSQMGFYLWHQHLKSDDSLWEAQIVLEGEPDPGLFERALFQAARRQQMLNVQLLSTSPPQFVPRSEPQLSFEYQDLSAAGEPVPAQEIFPLDIFKDPLLRCRLLKQGPRRYVWQIQAHHILADGLSCLILGRDFFDAYRQLLSPSQPPQNLEQLPPLRSHFSDYLALLEHERQTHGEAHLRYWQAIFAQPYQAPDLRGKGLKHEDSAESTGFFRLERKLNNRELAAFKQRCQAASSTLFMGVLAAYHQALVTLTGQADLIIGVAHHGRDYALEEIEQIFGCFARTLPLRLPALAAGPAAQTVHAIQIQAAQKLYQAAAAHPLDPLHVLRSLSPAPRLATLLGSQFFISAVDLTSLLEAEIVPGLRVNGQASSTHFQPSNQDMDLFLALKQQGEILSLTLNVHRAACSPLQAEAVMDQLLTSITAPTAPPSQAFDLAQTGPLDAALISYLPSLEQIQRVAPRLSLGQIQALKQRLFPNGEALWIEHLQTPLGQSANLVLPFFANEILPGQAQRLLPAIQHARLQAQALGARVVSLAGLLPALSAYGHDLPAIPAQANGAPQRLSTGHSTTVVAMLETLRLALAQLERPLASCRLAMVGLGSIGEATLHALLASQEHPASLTLVDRLGTEQRLRQLAEGLSAQHGYSGPVQWVLSPAESLPTEVYQVDLILSAVSARQVIDISQLHPGTVLIDDSFPHCFDVRAAITRMRQESDVLVIGGGLLQLPGSQQTRYLPLPDPELQDALAQVSLPACLPGCQLESLLLAAYPELPETLGLVDPAKLLQYLPVIQAAGIRAAPLHLEGYLVSPELIQALLRYSAGD